MGLSYRRQRVLRRGDSYNLITGEIMYGENFDAITFKKTGHLIAEHCQMRAGKLREENERRRVEIEQLCGELRRPVDPMRYMQAMRNACTQLPGGAPHRPRGDLQPLTRGPALTRLVRSWPG